MLTGPFVFVDIDTQRDFLEPTGALYIAGSAPIIPNLKRLTEFAADHGISVIASACAHEPDDAELAVFPPHCLRGTPGENRISATAWPTSLMLDSGDPFLGADPPNHVTLLKHVFDLFSHAAADRIVALHARCVPTFVVYGVATDYCVRCAVLGLLERGQRVAVVADAIHPIDAAGEPAILDEFVRGGALIVATEAVCRG